MSSNTEFCKLSNDIYAAMIRKIFFDGILILVKHTERPNYILNSYFSLYREDLFNSWVKNIKNVSLEHRRSQICRKNLLTCNRKLATEDLPLSYFSL